MFYIKGKHNTYGNVLWLEAGPAPNGIGFLVAPTPNPLYAEAFESHMVEAVRGIHQLHYPDYKWIIVEADSRKIIPNKMRKVINCA